MSNVVHSVGVLDKIPTVIVADCFLSQTHFKC